MLARTVLPLVVALAAAHIPAQDPAQLVDELRNPARADATVADLRAMGTKAAPAILELLQRHRPRVIHRHGRPSFQEVAPEMAELGLDDLQTTDTIRPDLDVVLHPYNDGDPNYEYGIEYLQEWDYEEDDSQVLLALLVAERLPPTPELVAALVDLMGHREFFVAHQAAWTLVELGDPAAPLLIEKAKDRRLGWIASSALGYTPKGREALVELAKGPLPAGITRAVVGLALGADESSTRAQAETLAANLGNSYHLRAKIAAWGLGRMPAAVAIPAIRQALRSDNARTRLYAGGAAAVLGAKGAALAPDLIAFLRDATPGEAAFAIQALGHYRLSSDLETKAIEVLAQRRDEDSQYLSTLATQALARMCGRSNAALERIAAILRTSETRDIAIALSELAQIGARAAPVSEIALKFMDDDNLALAAAAVRVAGAGGTDNLPEVLALVDHDTDDVLREAVIDAIAAMGPGAVTAVAAVARAPEGHAQQFVAVRALSQLGAPGTQALLDLARDDESLRSIAIGALLDSGDALVPVVLGTVSRSPERTNELVPLLGMAYLERTRGVVRFLTRLYEKPEHRHLALHTAIAVDPAAAQELIRRGAADADSNVRAEAAQALLHLGADEAVRLAIAATEDADRGVVAHAVTALGRDLPPTAAAMDTLESHVGTATADTAAPALLGLVRGGRIDAKDPRVRAALESKELQRRIYGLRAITHLGESAANLLPVALPLLHKGDVAVQEEVPATIRATRPDLAEAADAIEQIMESEHPLAIRFGGAMWNSAIGIGNSKLRDIDAILADLKSADPKTRAQAIRDLVDHTDGDRAAHAERVRRMLEDEAPMVRIAAAECLSGFGWDERADTALCKMLEVGNTDERAQAARAFERYGAKPSDRAILALRKATADAETSVRLPAVRTFADADWGEIAARELERAAVGEATKIRTVAFHGLEKHSIHTPAALAATKQSLERNNVATPERDAALSYTKSFGAGARELEALIVRAFKVETSDDTRGKALEALDAITADMSSHLMLVMEALTQVEAEGDDDIMSSFSSPRAEARDILRRYMGR